MSQHDYVIANADGATVRADLNALFEAMASLNAGGTAPTTTFAYMWWADTTNGLLKIRNAANTAWVTVGTLASSNLGLLTDPTTTRGDILYRNASNILTRLAIGTGVLKGDGTDVAGWSKILNADIDAAAAIALTKLATQAANTVLVNATGSAAVPTALALAASQLLGRDASGNISAIALGSGLSMTSGTLNLSASAGLTLLQSVSASGAATVDLETTIDSTYESYLIAGSDIRGANTSTFTLLRCKVSSYQTSNYAWLNDGYKSSGSAVSESSGGSGLTDGIYIHASSNSSSTNDYDDFQAVLHSPSQTSRHKTIVGDYSQEIGGTLMGGVFSGSYIGGNGAVTGVRIMRNSGNISGEFKLYGLKKS